MDADIWVQDPSVLEYYLRAAQRGYIALTPELDRGYWTSFKRPKVWGQNQKAFAWSYGLTAGYRLGRNPILNIGAFALRHDAPHWNAWAKAHYRALNRLRLRRPGAYPMEFLLSEQTALNYVVFGDKLPATFLPAYCNWFCGKGTPMYDRSRAQLIEPHEPHRALGLVHLAGEGMKSRCFEIATLSGEIISTKLTYDCVLKLGN